MSMDFFDVVSGARDPELDELISACLEELLPTLEPEDAKVIDQVDLQNMPPEQAAADLDISMADFEVRLRHARQLLKEKLIEMFLICPEPKE